MPDFRFNPPIPVAPATGTSGFLQELSLVDGKKPIAVARWYVPAVDHGAVQILELHVDAEHRRKGNGGLVLRELMKQVQAYHTSRSVKFRRLWISVEQKSQVNARAFLTHHGFHHVATIENILVRQDA